MPFKFIFRLRERKKWRIFKKHLGNAQKYFIFIENKQEIVFALYFFLYEVQIRDFYMEDQNTHQKRKFKI